MPLSIRSFNYGKFLTSLIPLRKIPRSPTPLASLPCYFCQQQFASTVGMTIARGNVGAMIKLFPE
jgi:hypothetical protein